MAASSVWRHYCKANLPEVEYLILKLLVLSLQFSCTGATPTGGRRGGSGRFQQVAWFAFHHRFHRPVQICVAHCVFQTVGGRRGAQIEFRLQVHNELLSKAPFFRVHTMESVELEAIQDYAVWRHEVMKSSCAPWTWLSLSLRLAFLGASNVAKAASGLG